jgi:hypothetical protein
VKKTVVTSEEPDVEGADPEIEEVAADQGAAADSILSLES